MQLTNDQINKIKTLRKEGKKLREISAIIGCHLHTVHRYCEPYEGVGRKEIQRRYREKMKRKKANLELKRKGPLNSDKDNDLITCCSCGEECDDIAPIEGEFMCEDCVG